ncbi:5170_t:CDS:2, partial [Diversispora eburnea]
LDLDLNLTHNNSETISNSDFKIATYNIRGFNDTVKRSLFFNYIKNKQFDIVDIAETNCGDNKREYESRAICIDLVLLRKMTICVMQIYLSSKKNFNVVLSSAIDRNNNSHLHFPESEIFPLLSSYDLINCYRIMFPENTGYTWKRDNSNEESKIDVIWMSHRWSDKITSCFLDNIKLITSSDHKLLGIKILKKWQIREKDKKNYSNGPKYNIKLMDKRRWLKFSELVTVEVESSKFFNGINHHKKSYNTLNKSWLTLKNIMIKVTDQIIPKHKWKKKEITDSKYNQRISHCKIIK